MGLSLLRIERLGTVAGLLIFAIASARCVHSAPTSQKTEPTTTVDRLLDEARQAEVTGDTARQFALLRAAVRIAPDHELARWQLGQIRTGDEWLSIEDTQRAAAVDPKQAAYRQLREEQGESPKGQLVLARWCRKNGLDDEARFHWASVLNGDPTHSEAQRALGMRWVDGNLVSRDQIEQAEAKEVQSRHARREWDARVKKWQRILAREREDAQTAVLDEVRRIDDPTAIVPVEKVTLAGFDSTKPAPDWQQRMGVAFVTALESMDDQAATESLVRHAVLAPSSIVRTSATEQLRHRPLHDYLPHLLDGLAMPVESSFHVMTDDDGSVHYMHTLYREGSHNDWSHQVRRAAFRRASDRQIAARLSADVSQGALADDVRSAGRATATAALFSNQFGREAMTTEQQVAVMNSSAAALNERIIPVLKEVTGKDLGNEPRAWWDWWTDDNDYYTEERPVYETSDDTYAQYTPPPIPVGGCECFAKGTLVWTKTGQQAIDTLELGDLVLAQDVNTGELAYKPVIGRTVRPPSPLLKFAIGREELITTKGHPFWVAGVGWRMAKELGEDAVLHGVTGSTRLASVEESETAEAYNLVVAEFNTYFVGQQGILVHDNTPRRPTRASVPGLAEK